MEDRSNSGSDSETGDGSRQGDDISTIMSPRSEGIIDDTDTVDGMTDADEMSQCDENDFVTSVVIIWRGYQDEVFVRYLQDFNVERNVDVTIEHDDGAVACHRGVLEVASPYMAKRIKDLEDAGKPLNVRIAAHFWLIKAFAELIYMGDSPVQHERFETLYHFLRLMEMDIGVIPVNNYRLPLRLATKEEMQPDIILALSARVIIMGGRMPLVEIRYRPDPVRLRAFMSVNDFQRGDRQKINDVIMRYRAWRKQDDAVYEESHEPHSDDTSSNAPSEYEALAREIVWTDDDETSWWWASTSTADDDYDNEDKENSAESDLCYCGRGPIRSKADGGTGRSCASCQATGLVIEPSANDQRQQRQLRRREQDEHRRRQRKSGLAYAFTVSAEPEHDVLSSPSKKRRKIDPEALYFVRNMIQWYVQHL